MRAFVGPPASLEDAHAEIESLKRTIGAMVHQAGGEIILSRFEIESLDCRLVIERLQDGSGVVYRTQPRGDDP